MISKRLLQEADILRYVFRCLFKEIIRSKLFQFSRSLSHPNIVGFRGLKKLQDGRDTLIMEECTISLGDMLEERHESKAGPLPAIQMRKVCTDMCDALDYLHNTAHLLHGDIKSYNVSDILMLMYSIQIEIIPSIADLDKK